jgi:hypothetical protein
VKGIPELIGKAEAAVLLGGVSLRTVDRLRAAGEIDTRPVGMRGVRITVQSIGAYLERQSAAYAERLGLVGEAEDENPFAIPMLEELKQEAALRRTAKLKVAA